MKTGLCYTNYTAFEQGIETIEKVVSDTEKIYFPYKIGCELAGGNIDIIHKIIERHLGDQAILIKYKSGVKINE